MTQRIVASTFLGILTLATSGMTMAKITTKMTEVSTPVQGISIQATAPIASPTIIPTEEPVKRIVAAVKPKGNCVVILFGIQYDVTELQNDSVSFGCGTDMTETYRAKHGNDVSRMQKYLLVKPTLTVASPTKVPSITPTLTPSLSPTKSPTATPTKGTYRYSEDKDEREDEENEDHYVRKERDENESNFRED